MSGNSEHPNYLWWWLGDGLLWLYPHHRKAEKNIETNHRKAESLGGNNESWKPSTVQLVIPRPPRGSRVNIANIYPYYAYGGPGCHVWIHLEPHNHQLISRINTCVSVFTHFFQVKEVKKNVKTKTSWKADPHCHIRQLNRPGSCHQGASSKIFRSSCSRFASQMLQACSWDQVMRSLHGCPQASTCT